MREDLLKELEQEYEQVREENERAEAERKEQIRREQPDLYALVTEREELIIGSLRNILKNTALNNKLPEQMAALSGKIREELVKKGYPEDYLAPIYRCQICRDRGKTGETIKEPCSCLKKAYQRKLRESIGLKSNRNECFEKFNLKLFSDEKMPGRSYSQRELMDMVRQTCEQWADEYPQKGFRDLILSGKSGLGKTFLLRCMAERMIERDLNVMILSAYRLLEIMRKSYFSNEENADELIDADVLMIDDLGSEPMMQNVTIEQLFNLLNERQSRGLSTVISTNLNMNEFRNRYTERIASRLSDRKYCRVILLEGADIRTGRGIPV